VDAFEADHLLAFRKAYPRGDNLVVAADVTTPFTRRCGDIPVRFVGLDSLPNAL